MVEKKPFRRGKFVESPGVVPDDVVGLTPEELSRVGGDMFRGLRFSTQDNYGRHLRYFEQWCEPRNIELKDVVTKHIMVYLDKARTRPQPASVSWLRGSVAAVKKALTWVECSGNVNWREIAEWICQQQIDERMSASSVDGLTWELIQEVETAAWVPRSREWPEKTRRRATADIAMLWLMWGCLLRRRELAAATWGDIHVEVVKGHVFGVLTIPYGKTDRYGEGEVGYVHVSTLALLQEMAVACGRDPSKKDQKIFGIGERQVWNRVNAACAHAGLPGRWGGHSPRIGAARDLVKHGTGLVGTMQAGRWKDPRTLWRYVRAMAVGDGAVARLRADLDREGGTAAVKRRLAAERRVV